MLQLPTTKTYAGDEFEIKYVATQPDPTALVALHLVKDSIPFNIPAIQSDDGNYAFSVDSAALQMPDGAYAVSVTSTTDGKRKTLIAGQSFTLRADPTKNAGLSYAHRMVIALRALILNAVSHDNAMFTGLSYDGYSVTNIDPMQRVPLLEKFEAILEREQRALGKKAGGPSRILWRFIP